MSRIVLSTVSRAYLSLRQPRNSRTDWWGRLAWGVITLIAAGCGPAPPAWESVHLAGTVLLAGQPLPEGCEATVRFMPTQPGQAPPASATIVGGKFDAPTVAKGGVTVVFNITRLTGRMVVEDNAPGGTPFPEREDLVPVTARQGVPYTTDADNLNVVFDLR